MIFTYFAVPAESQKRALIIGIIGAIVLRAILIIAGAWLLAKFHWLLYVFGAFLVVTGIKMWLTAGKDPDIEMNPVLKFLKNASTSPHNFMVKNSASWSMVSNISLRCLWC